MCLCAEAHGVRQGCKITSGDYTVKLTQLSVLSESRYDNHSCKQHPKCGSVEIYVQNGTHLFSRQLFSPCVKQETEGLVILVGGLRTLHPSPHLRETDWDRRVNAGP